MRSPARWLCSASCPAEPSHPELSEPTQLVLQTNGGKVPQLEYHLFELPDNQATHLAFASLQSIVRHLEQTPQTFDKYQTGSFRLQARSQSCICFDPTPTIHSPLVPLA